MFNRFLNCRQYYIVLIDINMMNLRKATSDGFEMINREIIAGDAHLNTNMQELNAHNIDFFSPTILA